MFNEDFKTVPPAQEGGTIKRVLCPYSNSFFGLIEENKCPFINSEEDEDYCTCPNNTCTFMI